MMRSALAHRATAAALIIAAVASTTCTAAPCGEIDAMMPAFPAPPGMEEQDIPSTLCGRAVDDSDAFVMEASPVDDPSTISVCTKLPEGLEGVLIPDVAYEVDTALYTCANVAKTMTVWCLPRVSEGDKGHVLYCCGTACENYPVVVVSQKATCVVEGNEYSVGKPYTDVKLSGQDEPVTLWCTSKEEYVTCKGDECGSTPQLTPPGVEVGKVIPLVPMAPSKSPTKVRT